MTMIWTNPELLSNHKAAKTAPGVYVIGSPKESFKPITCSGDTDAYLGCNWPNNFIPHYIGISESMHRGVKGRLSLHARGKGNLCISKMHLIMPLHFIAFYDISSVEYEALFLALKSDSFLICNQREENERSMKRICGQIRQDMGQQSCKFYDNLDIEKDGM